MSFIQVYVSICLKSEASKYICNRAFALDWPEEAREKAQAATIVLAGMLPFSDELAEPQAVNPTTLLRR